MSAEKPPEAEAPRPDARSDARSDMEAGLEALGRVATGLTARLLGPRAIKRDALPERPAISPEVDQAIGQAGDALGRLLHATGEALKEHPTDPVGAVREAQGRIHEEVTPPEGWSTLAVGARSLGGGLLKVTEGVLDVVAPRKKREEPPAPE